MKRFPYILLLYLITLPLQSCSSFDRENPYDDRVYTLRVRMLYPDGYDQYRREGVFVEIEDADRGNSYRVATDPQGEAHATLTDGIYRITVSDRTDGHIFNGMADKVRLVDGAMNLQLPLLHSSSGSLLIKEIYCGGCLRQPQEGSYQFDKYVLIHNNSPETLYLDSLCFGALDPYNSQATNRWVETDEQTGATLFPDFVPIIQAVWQFGGDGGSFPIAPGQDAVVVCCGAIDHASQYPLSVNLNKPGYFVCYNSTYFPNTLYHPAPGDQITPDHYLNVVIKTGIANAYPLSIYSPAPVIFRARGTTIQEFVRSADNVVQKPGDKNDFVVKIPIEWVIDGAEVFYGGSSSNAKRLCPSIDAGYVTQSDIYLGHTLHRHIDEEASRQAGYEVLVDTNNSSNDFYERTRQSLHE